ncbi:hypothetical protein BB560_003284 [Smittium megazygosporum]|uniref:Ribosomal protein S6 n=1 Tax=Smittium megazygosporum TaxID=133381 RepID=A0A2T9ZCE5_9FUNG|nr:hypothetical protein BB560_003284 [Smittium megazygosporum]
MPFYEILTISKAELSDVILGDLLKHTSRSVLDAGGVVRGFAPLGMNKTLPYRMHKNKEWHRTGSYWNFQFYANPKLASKVLDELRTDHRVIRANMIRIAEKFQHYVRPKE